MESCPTAVSPESPPEQSIVPPTLFDRITAVGVSQPDSVRPYQSRRRITSFVSEPLFVLQTCGPPLVSPLLSDPVPIYDCFLNLPLHFRALDSLLTISILYHKRLLSSLSEFYHLKQNLQDLPCDTTLPRARLLLRSILYFERSWLDLPSAAVPANPFHGLLQAFFNSQQESFVSNRFGLQK